MSNFDSVFERVMGSEGGFQNSRDDRGNWTSGKVGVGELKGTKWGVSAMSYPHLDIKNLTKAEAKVIFKADWWDKYDMDRACSVMQYQLIDAIYNHGPKNAVKILQAAIGTTADGISGPNTIAAYKAIPTEDLSLRFLAARLEFFTNISTWGTFGKGWSRRVAECLRFAAGDN
ncbi:MAG: glycoside hydrolase family 108 protein [Aeromonas sp.]